MYALVTGSVWCEVLSSSLPQSVWLVLAQPSGKYPLAQPHHLLCSLCLLLCSLCLLLSHSCSLCLLLSHSCSLCLFLSHLCSLCLLLPLSCSLCLTLCSRCRLCHKDLLPVKRIYIYHTHNNNRNNNNNNNKFAHYIQLLSDFSWR